LGASYAINTDGDLLKIKLKVKKVTQIASIIVSLTNVILADGKIDIFDLSTMA